MNPVEVWRCSFCDEPITEARWQSIETRSPEPKPFRFFARGALPVLTPCGHEADYYVQTNPSETSQSGR